MATLAKNTSPEKTWLSSVNVLGEKYKIPQGWKGAYNIDSEKAFVLKKTDDKLSAKEKKNLFYDTNKTPIIEAYTLDEINMMSQLMGYRPATYYFTIRSQIPLDKFEKVPSVYKTDTDWELGKTILVAHINTTPKNIGHYTVCMAKATSSYLTWKERNNIKEHQGNIQGTFDRCVSLKNLKPADFSFKFDSSDIPYIQWNRWKSDQVKEWKQKYPAEAKAYENYWKKNSVTPLFKVDFSFSN